MKVKPVNVLLVLLLVVGVVSYVWPQPFMATLSQGDWSVSPLTYLIAVTMLFIGTLLSREEVDDVLRNWPSVLCGTAIQYAAMPLVAFMIASIFRFESGMFVGLMVVGCVPGAMASNLLTLTAGGNTSYSVSLTTSATILSPLVVPLTMLLTLREQVAIDPVRIFVTLCWTVVGPVLSGHLLRRYIASTARWAPIAGPLVANAAILLIVGYVVAANRDKLVTYLGTLLLPLLLINLLGYASGYFGGRAIGLDEGKRRALTLEIGMQNAGLGVAIATNSLKQYPDATVAPAIYVFLCLLTGMLLAVIWQNFSFATSSDKPH